MPRSKILKYALCGALAAAVIALAVGLALYLPSINAEISSDAENYSQLVTARARKIIAGMILLFSGGFVSVVSALGLLVIALINKINTRNAKK